MIAKSQDLSEINSGTVITQAKVSFDGTKMVFVANYYGSLKPYISELNQDSAKWSKPEPLFTNDISSQFTVRYPQLSVDNSKVYFSGKHQDSTHFDIYYARWDGSKWLNPQLISIDVHTSQDEMAPAFSADESKLLFTRSFAEDLKKDEYCYELYFTQKSESGKWMTAAPLGPSYNTGCVASPYFSRDNKTFYYSSFEDVEDEDGKKVSKNKLNVFWAKIDGLFEYKPKVISEIMLEEDISSFSVTAGNVAYYSAGELTKGDRKLTSQIQSMDLSASFQPVEMMFLEGIVANKQGNAISATVKVVDPFTTKVFQELKTTKTGEYQFFLPKGKRYTVIAEKENHSTQSNLITTESDAAEINFELFSYVGVSFNVFDKDFYFPIVAKAQLYDSAFTPIEAASEGDLSTTFVPLGKELNIILTAENYFSDTINLPFDKEVIFDAFEFDTELVRIVKDVSLNFADEGGNNLGLEITVYNVTRNEKTKRYVQDGKVSLELRDGEVYEISTSAKGYSFYNKEIDLTEATDEEIEEVNVELKSIKNTALVLNDITFAYNSYELNAASYKELDNLVTYLTENETYNVEISAYTDDSGPAAYNLKLSNLRATSVLQYLQDNSISQERLVARGFGEAQPLFPNDSEENMAKNRRVEFQIIDED